MPAWVENEDIWEKAKKAVKKTGDKESYYKQVTAVYEKMGGKVKHKAEAIAKAVYVVPQGEDMRIPARFNVAVTKAQLSLFDPGKHHNKEKEFEFKRPIPDRMLETASKTRAFAGAARQGLVSKPITQQNTKTGTVYQERHGVKLEPSNAKNEYCIHKDENGKYVLRNTRNPNKYLASGMGAYLGVGSGKATFDTPEEAREYIGKYKQYKLVDNPEKD